MNLNKFLIDSVVATEDGNVQMVTKVLLASSASEAISRFSDGQGEEYYRGDPVDVVVVGISLGE